MRPHELKAAVITPSIFGALDAEYSNSRDKVQTEADSFNKVPLVFRAVRLRCDALTSVPVYVYPVGGDEAIDEYPFEDSLPLSDWLWLNEAALLLRGASYTLRLRNQTGMDLQQIQWVNPFTVTLKEVNGELVFRQQVGDRSVQWTEEDIHYIREFSPLDDIGPGVCAAKVALGSSQLQHYLTRFASKFFEDGAMPVVVMGLPAGTQGPERERVESFFKRTIQGVRNAFRVLAVTGEIKPEVVSHAISELAIPEVSEAAIKNISWTFDIPKTILTADSANYATAVTEYRLFTEKTLVPRCRFFEAKLNPFLADYGVRIKFAPSEMSEMQQDENDRATAFATYVNAGMNPDLAADILGVDIPETFEGERWKKDPAPVIVAPPVRDEEQAEEEMKKWEKKAIKRVKEGKSAQVSFESDKLTDELKSVTYNALGIAKTEADVKLIFRGA